LRTIERRDEVSNAALQQMAGAGGSIGSARPKANVLDEGRPWIVQFIQQYSDNPLTDLVEL